MHICPIVIENYGVVVSTPEQLKRLETSYPDLFNAALQSGDVERLLKSFALPCDHALEADASVDNGTLYGRRYKLEELGSHLNGYHRQKTVLEVPPHHSIDNDFSCSYATFSGDGEMVVQPGQLLQLKGCILDGITLRARPGSEIFLDDVEFSNCGDFGLIVEQNAKITRFSAVSFLDCRKDMLIRHADRKHVGCVIDFDDATAILNALERSIINNIVLEHDFHPNHQLLELRQPVRFINGSSKRLCFDIKEMEPEKDMILEGQFTCRGNVTLRESVGQTVALSKHIGKLLLDDAKQTTLTHTDLSDSSVKVIDSSVLLKHCTIAGKGGFVTYNSALHFKHVDMSDASALFSIKEYKPAENEIRISEPLPNEYSFEESSIVRSGGLFEETLPMRVNFKAVNITDSEGVVNLTNCEIIAERVISSGCKRLFDLARCTLHARNNTHSEDGSPYHLAERTAANIGFTEIILAPHAGIEIRDSKATLQEVTFRKCDNAIFAHKGDGLIEHLDCLFFDTRYRNLHLEHGNASVNLKDNELETA